MEVERRLQGRKHTSRDLREEIADIQNKRNEEFNRLQELKKNADRYAFLAAQVENKKEEIVKLDAEIVSLKTEKGRERAELNSTLLGATQEKNKKEKDDSGFSEQITVKRREMMEIQNAIDTLIEEQNLSRKNLSQTKAEMKKTNLEQDKLNKKLLSLKTKCEDTEREIQTRLDAISIKEKEAKEKWEEKDNDLKKREGDLSLKERFVEEYLRTMRAIKRKLEEGANKPLNLP